MFLEICRSHFHDGFYPLHGMRRDDFIGVFRIGVCDMYYSAMVIKISGDEIYIYRVDLKSYCVCFINF